MFFSDFVKSSTKKKDQFYHLIPCFLFFSNLDLNLILSFYGNKNTVEKNNRTQNIKLIPKLVFHKWLQYPCHLHIER